MMAGLCPQRAVAPASIHLLCDPGLGLETAMALAKAGCRVIISSRDLKAGEKAAAQIRAAANCAEVEAAISQQP